MLRQMLRPIGRSSEFVGSSLHSLRIWRAVESRRIRRPTLALQTILFRRRGERDKHDVQFGPDVTRGGRRILTLICPMSTSLAGCASHGAPTYPFVGAFFPGWMFCAVMGIVGAIAARGLFVVTGLNRVLPFQLFVCSSLGVMIATLAWILWFGR
jgi:hypothetical protein